mmetsp:Transcript_30344/g.81588  ORF Transcript_30344/g.81588 Transcript_30344/m.81588 type:complete len:276 (+) Transcript_30344:389-1216(+)
MRLSRRGIASSVRGRLSGWSRSRDCRRDGRHCVHAIATQRPRVACLDEELMHLVWGHVPEKVHEAHLARRSARDRDARARWQASAWRGSARHTRDDSRRYLPHNWLWSEEGTCRGRSSSGRTRLTRHHSLLSLRVHLACNETCIEAVEGHEFCVRACLDHFALRHDHDAVCVGNRGQAVSDDDGGASLEQPVQRILHQLLRLAVQCGGGLVEDEHGRVLEQRTGNGDALLLPTRDLHPPLPALGVVALLKVCDEVVCIGEAARALHVRPARTADS